MLIYNNKTTSYIKYVSKVSQSFLNASDYQLQEKKYYIYNLYKNRSPINK